MPDILEPGLDPLSEHQWDLGGLLIGAGGALCLGDPGDDGLDDVSEVLAEDVAGGTDGSQPAFARLAPRAITLNVFFSGTPAELADAIDAVRKVVSPLPNRAGTRLLRFRRVGEVAKRIAVQPAVGKPLTIPGDRNRLLHGHAPITIRLTAPDPVIRSDLAHEEAFTNGQTREIVNAGTLTAVSPTAWRAEIAGACTVSNVDWDEHVAFTAAATVREDRSLTTGMCNGPGGLLLPRWPLLRPGPNDIRIAGSSMTFRWRDTW